jgi:fibronectin type 3 domain-containing protein
MKEPKVTVTTSSNGVTVKWTQALQAKGYRVYRSEYNESTGKWSSWKTMGTAKYSVNSWTDRSVVSGVTYRYAVRSVNGKALSSYTPSNSIKYLSTPVLSGAIKTDDGNVITYQEVEGAEGYRIYRKTADIPWVAIADVTGGSNITYTDSQIEEGVEYVYTVRAISGSYLSYYDTKGVTCK